MFTIGLTGGIACGKSLAGRYLTEWGVEVCEADDLAHQEMLPGRPAYQLVIEHFGRDILNADKTINREILGRRIFASTQERLALNACVHPFVAERCRRWLMERHKTEGVAAAVIVPLLFEAALDVWDAVVCVAAPAAFQMEKLQRRGLSAPEARRRMASQMPLLEKIERSDFVILNSGSRAALRTQMNRFMNTILEIDHG